MVQDIRRRERIKLLSHVNGIFRYTEIEIDVFSIYTPILWFHGDE